MRSVGELDRESAATAVAKALGEPAGLVAWVGRGYSARTALVETGSGRKLVARFAPDPAGFERDRLATERFSGPRLPVPRTLAIRRLDDGTWLCVSEHIEGTRSDELQAEQAGAAARSVEETLVALHSTSLDGTAGYGAIDGRGHGTHPSWAAYLADDFCHPDLYCDAAVDAALVRDAWAGVRELAGRCPEERHLVHGDFGADNLLIRDGAVVAVLDWESALVGDWAVDLAGCEKYPLEAYGDLRAAHARAGFDMRDLDLRVSCYRLRGQIGLVHWIWDRTSRGLDAWQSLDDAQSELAAGLARVRAGATYGPR